MSLKKGLDEYLKDPLENKIVGSNIPEACKRSPCIIGVSESGRDALLGPMLTAVAYYPQTQEYSSAVRGFVDAKFMDNDEQKELFTSIQQNSGHGCQDLGFMVKITAPNVISSSMLRRNKHNLNALSEDAAIDLIKRVCAEDVEVAKVYLTAVNPIEKYIERFENIFPGIEFETAKEASIKYQIVGVAKVCAKFIQTRIFENWNHVEGGSLKSDQLPLGNGSRSHPDTKKLLNSSRDPVFGFPSLVRFSWSPVIEDLKNFASECEFNKYDREKSEELRKKQVYFKSWLQTGEFSDVSKFFGERDLSKVRKWGKSTKGSE